MRSGFTLMETALAIVIVGTGVLSIMAAQAAFHKQNDWSTHASTATFLANEIREMTVRMNLYDPVTGTAFWGPETNETLLADFDDLDDFDGVEGLGTYFSAADGTGPVNAQRQVIPDMDGWSQQVVVYNVDPQDISAEGSADLDGQTNVIRMEVTVFYQGINDEEPSEVTRLAWICQ
jgi:hypothetical protein